MPQAEHSVTIDRPVHEVFAYVADGAKNQSWRSGVTDISLASGTAGTVGARYTQGMKGPGGRIAADIELTLAGQGVGEGDDDADRYMS